MDDDGPRRLYGESMAAAGSCRACGVELREGARFCDRCGAPAGAESRPAEYKQVTILFADVVRSMDIAARVGPERLREIMADLVNTSAAVIERSGGTLNSYTGDGLMALFGAPAALEDHAFRACLAALDIQHAAEALAAEVMRRDGVTLRLRIGINSGQVIAGEIRSSPGSYTAVGDQVGMAQRMESVAPAGGVMLSEASARLVEGRAELGDPELVRIKGADDPAPARRLLGVAPGGRTGRHEATLIGREREMDWLTGMFNQTLRGAGRAVCVVGPPGIGKSRLIGEIATIAVTRGTKVFSTFCQSHTGSIPFYAVSGLLRAVFEVDELDAASARERVRARLPGADTEDLVLLDDLLGIRDGADELPVVDPEARRRRLARLVDSAVGSLSRPAVYVVEDVHWVDDVSESMFVELMSALAGTSALVLITHRPEYRGALSRVAESEVIVLAPLDGSQGSALTAALLGTDPSTAGLAMQIAERAAGNPFFAEEIVRDLVERNILEGRRGEYVCRHDTAEVTVPATVQATIATRIDRLGAGAKRTLNIAAVIGSRFNAELLADARSDPALADLVDAELIEGLDPVGTEYAFRHPLIRAVAYESQLNSERAQLHRQLAAAIERREPTKAEENAALIATHLSYAGDFRAAFGWHMRAARWLTDRDLGAARASWRRARQVADRLPANEPDRLAMQIAPLTWLCGSMWMAGGEVADTGFDELRELCEARGDKVSLAIGMAGLVMALAGHRRLREASQLASELTTLVEVLGDPALTVNLLTAAVYAKSEVGEMTEALHLAKGVIDLSNGDLTMGDKLFGSPLALATRMRCLIRLCLGIDGWRSDADAAVAMAAALAPKNLVAAIFYKYIVAIPVGALAADAAALRETAGALQMAEQAGDEYTLAAAQLTRGLVLVRQDDGRKDGFKLLTQARDAARTKGFTMNALAVVDPEIAREKARQGDLDGAIELARTALDEMFERGAMFLRGVATTILVESLLARGAGGDLLEAQAAIDRLEEVPVEPGFVLHEIPLLRLRALVAQTHGDEAACHELMKRCRAKAASAGFEPLVAVTAR
jgi:class 3 adenylate cyclase